MISPGVEQACARTDWWTWLFTGQSRAVFMEMGSEERRLAVRAALRIMASITGADAVFLKIELPSTSWENDLWRRRYPIQGSFGSMDDRQKVMRADFVMQVNGGFKVLKSRDTELLESGDYVKQDEAWVLV